MELVAAMTKVAGPAMRRAMTKAAESSLPRAPSMGTKLPKGLPNLVQRQAAPQPELMQTQPETTAAQKNIPPPSI